MPTLSEKILQVAESQLGVFESGGPNLGGCERYQDPWGSWMRGQPWCGAFVAWCWEQAGAEGMKLASPSTATMCDIAQGQGLTGPPRPGAAFVFCGKHTGLLHHDLGGGVWKTIEGNSGDAVNWRQRSFEGAVIYGPPGLEAAAAAPAAPATKTWYFIEDLRSKRLYGGWASQESCDDAFKILDKRLKGKLRRFKDPTNPAAPFFIEDTSQTPRYYGGWTSKAARDEALKTLEKRLGHRLRAFSRKRPVAAPRAAAAQPMGKVD
jgi:hypothetical protein